MRTFAIVGVFCVAACGGGSVSFDDYPQAVHDAFCRYLAKCGEIADVTACDHDNLGFRLTFSPSETAAHDMGKFTFDDGKAGECLDAYANRSCDMTSESYRVSPAACSASAKGTVAGNGACALDIECVSQTCTKPTCTTACCMGTCTGDTPPAEAAIGASCGGTTGSLGCVSGAYCDFSTTTCTALKAAGTTCMSTSECAYGNGCSGTTARTCQPQPALGEACPNGQCRDFGTTCNATSKTCVKVGLAGATCATRADCGALLSCDTTTMTCVEGPSLGQPCKSGDTCRDDGAFCEIPSGSLMGTCTAPLADGATCTSNSQCQSDSCDTASMTCMTPPVCI